MPDKKLVTVRESGTHYTLKLAVEGHDLVVLVDKQNFTITIPYFEYMNVYSIVKIIAQIFKEDKDNPVLNEFLSFLRQSENAEELGNLRHVFRQFHC